MRSHSILVQAEFPDWLGRIPSQIGVPAGGSLSADEWKALVLVFGPLAVCPNVAPFSCTTNSLFHPIAPCGLGRLDRCSRDRGTERRCQDFGQTSKT